MFFFLLSLLKSDDEFEYDSDEQQKIKDLDLFKNLNKQQKKDFFEQICESWELDKSDNINKKDLQEEIKDKDFLANLMKELAKFEAKYKEQEYTYIKHNSFDFDELDR